MKSQIKKDILIFHVFLCLIFIPTLYSRAIDGKQELVNYGFLDSVNADSKNLEIAIKKFQKINNLEITGILDNSTMQRMSSPRCGRPSNAPLPVFTARNRWRKNEITYKVRNWTQPFTKSQIEDVFENYIKVWTKQVDLQITKSTTDRGDIEIYFTKQDGRYNVVGYAYYPENGDIFFDVAEDWTLDKSLAASRTYFGWVAAHELGHALGLPHTETMQSIMFPYYHAKVSEPSEIDINNLKNKYGSIRLDNDILCQDTTVDAILDRSLIKGNQYWDFSGESLHRGPYSLNRRFPGIPNRIDAAVSVNGKIYIFKDNLYYKFDREGRKLTQKLISAGFDKLLPSNIDAAFFDPKKEYIYFFKGSQYYVFDIRKPLGKQIVAKDKSVSKDWDQVPNDLEAATLLTESKVLFIKKSRCYLVNLESRQLISDEKCASTYYNCNSDKNVK